MEKSLEICARNSDGVWTFFRRFAIDLSMPIWASSFRDAFKIGTIKRIRTRECSASTINGLIFDKTASSSCETMEIFESFPFAFARCFEVLLTDLLR